MLNSLSIGFESAGAIVELAVLGDLQAALRYGDVLAIQVRAIAQGIHARSDMSCRFTALWAFAQELADIQLGHAIEARLSAEGQRVSTVLVMGQGAGKGATLSVLGCPSDERLMFHIQDWVLSSADLQELRTWCETVLGYRADEQ